ncbi:hypothetical protein MASR2M15_18530 [Anaerolineales bacterium]
MTACTLSDGSGPTATPEITGAPLVTINSPLPNATFLVGTEANILARIENAGPDIAKVEVKVNDTLIGQADNPNPSGARAFTITQKYPTYEAGQFTISIVAFRADGSASVPATVMITVVAKQQASATPTQTVTATVPATATTQAVATQKSTETTANTGNNTNTQATQKPAETQKPAATTSTKPRIKVISGANVRNGPSTAFDPPSGSLKAGDEADIIAVNPAGDWFKIQYWNGTAWIYSELVETTGNISNLTVDAGPPLPPTKTPTPLPTATTIPVQVDLIVENVVVNPHPLVCNQTSSITVTVKNVGSAAASAGGLIRVEAVRVADGAVLGSTDTPFPALGPGAAHAAVASLTVSTFVNEEHFIRAVVDISSTVSESNESNNMYEGANYILQKGSCP